MEKTQHLKVPNSVFQSWNFMGDIMTFGGRRHPCLRDCLAFLDTWGKKWTKRGIQSSFWNTDHFSIRSVLLCNTEDVVPLLLNWNPAKIVHVIINRTLFFGAPRIFGRNSWTPVYSEASALVKNDHQSFANTRLRCHSQAWPETNIAGKRKWPRNRANSQHFQCWSRSNNKKCRGNIWSW